MMKSALVAFMIVVSSRPVHADQPALATGPVARQAADQLMLAARGADDRTKFAACGKAYLDIYRAEPKAADGDQLLFNAAICFEGARTVDVALQTLAQLRKSHPKSKLDARAHAMQGAVYGRTGSYEEAATQLESYARKYSGEQDAFDAIRNALTYRMIFGPDAKAIEDAKLLVKLFGATRPNETAEAMFAVTAVYERAGDDALIAHLRDYLKNHARAGGPGGEEQRAVVVNAKLGEALWRRACPVKEVDGLCVKVVRDRANLKIVEKVTKGAIAKQCGPRSTPASIAVPRDPGRVKAARLAFSNATQLFDARPAMATDPVARAASARARLFTIDHDLETYIALPFPANLDFGGAAPTPAAAKSIKQFSTWVETKSKLGATARAGYEAMLTSKDAAGSIAAAARLGQVSGHFATTLLTVGIPPAMRIGKFAAERTEAFCDKLTEVAVPVEKRALDAYKVCLAKSSELGIDDGFTRLCIREHGLYDPRLAATASELFATPTAPTAITIEPAIRANATLTPAFTATLAKFDEVDKAGWSPPMCRSLAAQFTAIAKPNPTVDALYMIGLSFHRCGLVDDARRAYEQATKLRSDHAASLSNLAELQWRAGSRDVAKQAWEAALVIDAKLYAANVNLAAATIEESRALAGAARAKLIDRARARLKTALAVDDAEPGAYVAFASLEIDRPIVAGFFVAEATRRAPKRAAVALATAAVHARRGVWDAAVERFQAALGLDASSNDAHLGLALAQLRLRRFDAARAELALVKIPSYELHVAIGVAHRNLARHAEAIAAYERAITLMPTRAEAHFDLGILHTEVSDQGDDVLASKVALGKAQAAYRRATDVATGELKLESRLRAEQIAKTIVQIDAFVKAAEKPALMIHRE